MAELQIGDMVVHKLGGPEAMFVVEVIEGKLDEDKIAYQCRYWYKGEFKMELFLDAELDPYRPVHQDNQGIRVGGFKSG